MQLNLYRLIRPLLFQMDAEQAHDVCFALMKVLQNIPRFSQGSEDPKLLTKMMGLEFSNPVGLAAGLDKDAELIPFWEKLGFGFIEVGTVTPKPQEGNPKPRIFRLKSDHAIINRLGFNNSGLVNMQHNLEKHSTSAVLGINIGKNKDTDLENADSDYLKCFEGVAPFADYITVNLSSPNTPGLRDLQQATYLSRLLDKLKDAQAKFKTTQKPLPICVKIAPDLQIQELEEIVDTLLKYKIEGLIATNTTIARPDYIQNPLRNESGGLSGQPLFHPSNEILKNLKERVQDQICLIGVGGIMSDEHAKLKFKFGADLIQLYSGFIYHGPKLIKNIKKSMI